MVKNSHMVNMGCFFTIGLGLSTLGPLILNAIFEWTDEWGTMLMTGAIVGGVLGLVLGTISAVTRGPHPDEEDGRSMTDEEFAYVSSPTEPVVPNYEAYVKFGDWMDETWQSMLTQS